MKKIFYKESIKTGSQSAARGRYTAVCTMPNLNPVPDSEENLKNAQALGYKTVFWSLAYADWDTSNPKGKQYAFDTVTSRLHPGCILLLHAVSQDNADALGDIIDYAREQGYEFKAL